MQFYQCERFLSTICERIFRILLYIVNIVRKLLKLFVIIFVNYIHKIIFFLDTY